MRPFSKRWKAACGYWAGNHFRYGPPKFSMNATPQCYDYEIGSPGWSFFYSNQALPDNRLGIAQLSNRLLIPPDALPFQGNPNGRFLGYTWMALPFTESRHRGAAHRRPGLDLFSERGQLQGPDRLLLSRKPGARSASCSTILIIYGRGLDARPGTMGGGAMEINTVPCFQSSRRPGRRLHKAADAAVPGGRSGANAACPGRDLLFQSRPL